MQQKSLGLIETQGLAAGIEAADAAVKSANVELVGYELTKGGGWTTIKILGDVGAVKAAVDAARIAAGKVSRVVSTRVIARPSMGLTGLIHNTDTVGDQPPEPPAPPAPTDPPEPPKPPADVQPAEEGASGTTESLEEVQPVEVEPSGTTESLEEVQPVEVEPRWSLRGRRSLWRRYSPLRWSLRGRRSLRRRRSPQRRALRRRWSLRRKPPLKRRRRRPPNGGGRSPQNAEPRRKAGRQH
ncbi:MAG: BMC domain-containing protein [Flavonifractor plautii]|nr:BMC domain-containing protein [Flavonifractor plautii]